MQHIVSAFTYNVDLLIFFFVCCPIVGAAAGDRVVQQVHIVGAEVVRATVFQ